MQQKWPNNTTMRTRVVRYIFPPPHNVTVIANMLTFDYLYDFIRPFSCSGFVFLRLICPAILNPRMFNIITGQQDKEEKKNP